MVINRIWTNLVFVLKDLGVVLILGYLRELHCVTP